MLEVVLVIGASLFIFALGFMLWDALANYPQSDDQG